MQNLLMCIYGIWFDFDGNPSNDQLAKGASCILQKLLHNKYTDRFMEPDPGLD